MICNKFSCNLHFIDEKRTDYRSQLPDKYSILKSLRNILNKILSKECNLNLLVDSKINEFNHLIETKKEIKKLNLKKLVKKINLEENSEDSDEDKNKEKDKYEINGENKNKQICQCSSNCILNDRNYKNNNQEFSNESNIKNIVIKEYIKKYFNIYLFDSCEIRKSLFICFNHIDTDIPECVDVRNF